MKAGGYMECITVAYILNEEQIRQLHEITVEFNKRNGIIFSQEKVFGMIMNAGSESNINKKLEFHGQKVGLRK